ncbi:helix-turn-helix domain-containing protein [Paenibacillus roseipurpureus]|uniref:Helix-turn-helix domain-containing protein n=1 Tax=Paenibacillus roseopurpureus TaxID=2918901 RepID=A0AA96LQX3_9BACL|nr:helix-turn-helix domain-containing protein [Paenibacillus sp. MBLB1832]WNR45554.1 helix-turn-helix domain-containing protein [Paenibacillus sp. MBLB1832]
MEQFVNKRNTWFYRLLLSYVPVFFVVSSLLIIGFFMLIVYLSKQEAKRANDVTVQTFMQSVDQSLKVIDSMLMQSSQSDRVLAQFVTDARFEESYFNHYQVIGKLNDWIDGYPLVDSAYAVRWSDGLVIMQTGSDHLERFPDRAYVMSFKTNTLPQGWSEARKDPMAGSDARGDIVSLVHQVPLQTSGLGIVVVNVRISELMRSIKDKHVLNVDTLCIRGRDGALLYASSDAGCLSASTPMPVSAAVSSYTGWHYMSAMPHSHLLSYASVFSYIWVIGSTIVTILGLVFFIYITKRNYKPIEAVLTQIRLHVHKKSQPIPEQLKDEFQWIESTFEGLLSELSDFQKQSERERIVRQKITLQLMLLGGLSGNSEHGVELDLLPQHGAKVIMIVEMDHYPKFLASYTSSDQFLLKYVLTKALQELAEHNQLEVWTEWMTSSRLALLLLGKNTAGIEAELSERIEWLANALQDWVVHHLPFTVTLGIGHEVFQVEQLPEAYGQAEEVLRYKWLLEQEKVLWGKRLKTQPGKELLDYQVIVQTMAESLRLGDERWETDYEQIFEEARQSLLSRDDMLRVLQYMLYALDKELSSLGYESMEDIIEQVLSKSRELIHHIETLKELKENLKSPLQELFQRIRELRVNQQHHKLIVKVKSFIEGHYSDPDFSLTTLSDEFGLTGNYLSKLFKSEFGDTFVNYLIKIRIQKAKELLLETNETIQTIGQRVGYVQTISFNRAFKKLVGRSPGEYRKLDNRADRSAFSAVDLEDTDPESSSGQD